MNVSKIKIKKYESKNKGIHDVSDIFTSKKIENMSLVSRMYFHVKSTSGIFYSKTLISI